MVYYGILMALKSQKPQFTSNKIQHPSSHTSAGSAQPHWHLGAGDPITMEKMFYIDMINGDFKILIAIYGNGWRFIMIFLVIYNDLQ